MDLMDLLASAGGNKSVENMGKQLGLGGADTGKLIGALAPALLKGIQGQAQSANSAAGLQKALSSATHQRYLDNPELVSDEATRTDGNNILGHLFGSKDVSRNVAADAAKATGIDPGLVKKALPILAGLAMGALSKKSTTTAGQTDLGGLGSLLAGLGGGKSSAGVGDLLGMARKLF
ncbi:MAG: DUF937 domain-containing protein [Gammaproteobacteria bacterium]|nr:DUF937 domain-containing protein [Gammaproteobacteria bacterium]MDH4315717.1 DUF937 domain-containing protein [Gammaproteobacteria bacterium]MDH5213449.1 DUF937 domain-containing protein [Gammaproteobacteria bacterium]MDH5499723.1 DUF937 domain-containing protein [Gammaproteobacteria bacterium]